MTKRMYTIAVVLALLWTLFLPASAADPAVSFSDVKDTDWFADAVYTAAGMGLINGKGKDAAGQDYFDPEGNITLAEAVKLAACMNQLHTEGAVTLTNGDPWYESYADYGKFRFLMASEMGFSYESVMGMPDKVLNRAEFAWIFARALPEDALPAINAVPHNAIPDMRRDLADLTDQQRYLLSYYEEVYTLYRAGIVNGSDAAGTFHPESNIRRSEVAAIAVRMMQPEKRVGAPEKLQAPSAGVTLDELYNANLLSNLMKRHANVTTIRTPGEIGGGTSYWITDGSVVSVTAWDSVGEDGVKTHNETGTYGDFGYDVAPDGQVKANLWVSGFGHMPMDDAIACTLPVELTKEIEILSRDGDTLTFLLTGLYYSGPKKVPGETRLTVYKDTLEFRFISTMWTSENGEVVYYSEKGYEYDGAPVGQKVMEGWDRTRAITYEIRFTGQEPHTETFFCPAAWDLTLTPMPGYGVQITAEGAEELSAGRFHVAPGDGPVTVRIS